MRRDISRKVPTKLQCVNPSEREEQKILISMHCAELFVVPLSSPNELKYEQMENPSYSMWAPRGATRNHVLHAVLAAKNVGFNPTISAISSELDLVTKESFPPS